MLSRRSPFNLALLTSILTTVVLCTGCPPSADLYEGIPLSAEFPSSEPTLQKLIADNDVHRMRRHSWYIFSDLTKPSRHDKDVARWESWYDGDVVFAMSPTPPGPSVWPSRPFAKDGELPFDKQARGPGGYALYNREAYRHIRDFCLYRRETYQCLKDHGEKDVPAFPPSSIVLKADWQLVSRGTPLTLGVWDSERPAPGVIQSEHFDWPRVACVAVDTHKCTDPHVQAVSVKNFYNVKIRDEDVKRFKRVDTPMKFQDAKPNDVAILVALHFATREQPNWVWSTFWWHPEPKNGPYADDRPENSLTGPWRNYMMSVSYDMDKPREPDGKPHIAHNPYLEAASNDGVTSNCVTCHRRATWPSGTEKEIDVLNSDGSMTTVKPRDQPMIVVRGSDAATETYLDEPFEDQLKLSFLWTLRRATQQPPAPADQECNCEQVLARIRAARAKLPSR